MVCGNSFCSIRAFVTCAALSTVFLAPSSSIAGTGVSKKQSDSVEPATPSKPSPASLNLTEKYCAQALPYQVIPPITGSSAATVNVQIANDRWLQWLKPLGTAQLNLSTAALTIPSSTAENSVFPSSGQIDDPGKALLLDSTKEFSQNTTDAQRLAIRLMYEPTFSMLACSYAYLTDNAPTTGPPLGPDGKPEGNFSKITQQPFSLSDYDYYVFNVVHWQDAPAPQQVNGKQQAPPMYQATADNWYVLNYKDARDHHRDLATAFAKFKPQFVNTTPLKFLASDKVLFVAVHLAPPVTLDAPTPTGLLSDVSAPTEQAWYDNVKIQYQFTAKTATPVNVADLQQLIGILLNVSQPQTQTGTQTQNSSPQLSSDPLKQLSDQLSSIADYCGKVRKQQLDCYLYNIQGEADAISAKLLGTLNSLSEGECKKLSALKSSKDLVANLGDVTSCQNVAINNANEKQSVVTEIAAADKSAQVLNASLGPTGIQGQPLIASTWQGVYGASELTNLAGLPTKFSGATNLVGTWKATFSAGNNNSIHGTGQQTTAAAGSPQSSQPSTNSGNAQPATGAGAGGPQPASNPTQASTQPTGGSTGAASQSSSAPSKASSKQQATTICTLSVATAPGGTTIVQSPCSNSGETIHDEGLAHWDVSIAVPVTGYKQLTFQSGSNGGANAIVAQSVSRTNAYGMFDIFLPVPGVDLNSPPVIGFPYVAAGLPLSGAPLDKPYFAIAENATFPGSVAKIPGLGFLAQYIPIQVRPMFGWVWVKQFTKVAASGSTPASTIASRALHPQWSIEFSIKSVAASLGKSNTKQNTTSNTTKPASPTK